MKVLFFAVCWGLGFVFLATAGRAQEIVDTLLVNGPNADRINIVFLAEGYTATQRTKFTNEAQVILNRVLTTPPFNDYRPYFNAYAVFVVSAEAGSDHPSRNILRNTYFNSSYDSYQIQRLITIPPNNFNSSYSAGEGKVQDLLQRHLPDYDLAFLVVNDTEYGGSGGNTIISSVATDSANIGVHELAHNYAGLGDEYGDPYPGYPDIEEPNTTRETNRELIKWRSWILPTTPVPTPATTMYASVVGLFEGAHYHTTGWYRPKRDCKMRTLNAPFCEVCAEALVISTYSILSPIESVSPATNYLTLTATQAVVLTASAMQPSSLKLRTQWLLNTQPIPGATNDTLHLAGDMLTTGTNVVSVLVEDPTPKVRNDPLERLRETFTWTVMAPEAPPAIALQRETTRVVLSWPTTPEGFVLETANYLGSPKQWFPPNGSPVVLSNVYYFTNAVSEPAQFFRLRKL